jgi:hypothetical protein
MGQTKLRLVGAATAIEIAPEIRAAHARLAKDKDQGACLLLTGSGVLWVRADAHDPTTFHLCNGGDARPTRDFTPLWDRDNRVLSLGGQIVRRYGRSSPNQEAVLQAFQEQGWPYRIADPLPYSAEVPPKLRLHDTIRWLNLRHECRLVRFLGDGTGEGVCWKLLASSGLILHGHPAEELRPAA